MANLLKDPEHVAKLRKFPHNLTHIKKFSSSVGHLLPVFYDVLYPGDKISFRTEMFTQLKEMVTPAMVAIENHIDWYFVPLKHISQFAPNLLYDIKDFQTTFVTNTASFNSGAVNVIPQISYQAFVASINSQLAGKTNYSSLNGFSENLPNFARKDIFGVPNIFNAYRLSQLLGFGRKFPFDTADDLTTNFYFNPMLLCAYQKIWYDVFRLTDRIPNRQSAYNLDKYALNGVVTDADVSSLMPFFLQLHYRPWERDFFTSGKVSPLVDVNDTGMISVNSASESDSLAAFNNWLSGMQNLPSNESNRTIGFSGDLASLRGSFAAEKLMRITRFARKHYDAQTLAHFGEEVPHGIGDEVYRLGSESCVVSINEVFATNTNDQTNLGQKGGRGAAFKAAKKPMKFKAPCHGIVMALFSSVPQADYAAIGFDRFNQYRTRYDFFQPEHNNLDMQPLFAYQLSFAGYDNVVPDIDFLLSSIVNWQWRFMESKCQLNRAYGDFLGTSKAWTAVRDMQPYMTSSMSDTAMFRYGMYYINPQFLDSFMLMSFQNAATDDITIYNTIYARDPMLHWCKFYVFKSSVMTTFGLPQM